MLEKKKKHSVISCLSDLIIFPRRHHVVLEQDMCQINKSPRFKTEAQVSTTKSKIPKL